MQPRGRGGDHQLRTSGFFVVVVVLLVVGGVFAAWYHFLASAAARAQVEDVATSVQAFGVSLAGLIGDRVSECWGRAHGKLPGSRGSPVRYTALDEELNYFQPLPAPAPDAAQVVVNVGQPRSASEGGANGLHTAR